MSAALLLANAASALATVHYVDLNSTNATPPYTNWATAAGTIQDAVDAAAAGDEVVVANGSYYPVSVGQPLSVRSVNGPQSTAIDGGDFVRCVYLTDGASLSGFTLTHGYAEFGAGVFCESQTAVVSNCVVSGNIAQNYDGYYYGSAYGGGAYGGTLNNCTLAGNRASVADIGFGSGESYGYGYGGGAYDCTLNNCTLTGNSAIGGGLSQDATAAGGGAYGCTLNNCTLRGNSVRYDPRSISYFVRCSFYLTSSVAGGGAAYCTLNNCILSGNNATGYFYSWQGLCGGGLGFIYINVAGDGANDYGSGRRSCWTTDPLFVDPASGNLRLQTNSPCINAGYNAYAPAGPDLDGNPRIAGGRVDIGAYEFQSPASMISYAWLQQYGLPINGSTDTADPDGDGVSNYHEWLAGTNPTNRFSSPAQLTITASGIPPSGIILTWSTNAVGFTLQSTTNLLSPAAWVTNSPAPVIVNGQNTVTNPITGARQFYRLVH